MVPKTQLYKARMRSIMLPKEDVAVLFACFALCKQNAVFFVCKKQSNTIFLITKANDGI